MATGGGDLIQVTSASSSTGQIVVSATPYVGNPRAQAVPADQDGKELGWLIEHSTIQSEWELVEGVYTHSTRTVTRPAAKVALGTNGPGVNTDFSTGGLIVSVVDKYENFRQFILFRGGGITINESDEFPAGGQADIDIANFRHRLIKVAGATDTSPLTLAMAVALPDPDTAEWGDVLRIKKNDSSQLDVTLVGSDNPISPTANAGADTFTLTDHGLTNDRPIILRRGTVPGNTTAGTVYWIINATDDTWQIAATVGGAAIDLTSAGSGFVAFVGRKTLTRQGQYQDFKVTGAVTKKWERAGSFNDDITPHGQDIMRSADAMTTRALIGADLSVDFLEYQQITSGTVTLTTGQQWLRKDAAGNILQVIELIALNSTPSSAIAITVPDSDAISYPGAVWIVNRPAAQTGAVTVARQTNGTINDGATPIAMEPGWSTAIIKIASNPGSAPDIRVQGGIVAMRFMYESLFGNDNVIFGIELRDYSETSPAQTGVTGALTIDYAAGNYHHITHGAGNITSTTINNWPATGKGGNLLVDFKQDGVGGRTMVQPTGFVWAGGAPTFNTAAGKTNRVLYTTRDAGTTIVLSYGGSW